MVRGGYIDRADASQLLLKTAMDRYLWEVSSTKKPSTHAAEKHKAKAIKAELGGYSLAALNANLIASYRDQRLADGKSANTVRLEPSLLSHLFTIAIKEWRLGLVPAVMETDGPMNSVWPGKRSSRTQRSLICVSTTCAKRPSPVWSRPASVTRKSPPSLVTSPCRCSSAIHTCAPKTRSCAWTSCWASRRKCQSKAITHCVI